MTVQHLPATASPDDVAAALAADGCAVIDRVVSPEILDHLDDEMAGYVACTA